MNFYSALAAQSALKVFGQNLIHIQGKACKIVHKKRDLVKKGRLLYINQCEDLVNHYIGFNCWKSQILYHQKEGETDKGVTYATAVRLVFGDVSVEGVGLCQAEYSGIEEKLHKIPVAQKSSKNSAMVNAFAKLLLVLVFDDSNQTVKATMRIDHQVKDPFYYNATWDNKPVIEHVNELLDEPELED